MKENAIFTLIKAQTTTKNQYQIENRIDNGSSHNCRRF